MPPCIEGQGALRRSGLLGDTRRSMPNNSGDRSWSILLQQPLRRSSLQEGRKSFSNAGRFRDTMTRLTFDAGGGGLSESAGRRDAAGDGAPRPIGVPENVPV